MMTLVASCERHVHLATIDVGSIASINVAIEKLRPGRECRERKEAKDFSKYEAEPFNVVSTLQRAISIFRNEMAEDPAFLHKKTTHATGTMLRQLFTAVTDAAAFLVSTVAQPLVPIAFETEQSGTEERALSLRFEVAHMSFEPDHQPEGWVRGRVWNISTSMYTSCLQCTRVFTCLQTCHTHFIIFPTHPRLAQGRAVKEHTSRTLQSAHVCTRLN